MVTPPYAPSVRLRPAVVDDLDALVAVQEAGAVAALGHIFPQDVYPFRRDVILERWRGELWEPGTVVYVCTDDAGLLTGFAARREDELLHFGTAIDTWGSGLATQLHDALLASFPATVTRCRLRVFVQNLRARRFYEKLGWVSTGALTRSAVPPHPELVEYTRSRSYPETT